MRDNTLCYSIIMPCYNSEAYVRDAVESILRQTYPNWELIAINDGSTDKTLEILTEYSVKYNNIKVFTKENGGYVSAVNTGLTKITGDYFLLLGSDDRLTDTILADLYQYSVEKYPDCIAFRTSYVVDHCLKGYDEYTKFDDHVYCQNTNFALFQKEYPVHSAIFCVRDTSKCYKTTILNGLQYFGKYGIDADGIFSMLICHNASSFMIIPADGYLWTLRADSLSARKATFERECDRLRNWISFFEVLQELPAGEITEAEQKHFEWFLDDISSFWKNTVPFFKEYALVRNAVRCVKIINKQHKFNAIRNLKRNMLIHFPVLWKIVWASYSKIVTLLR